VQREAQRLEEQQTEQKCRSECSSPAATAPHGRRQQPGHRPGHHGHVRTTEDEASDSTFSKVHRREGYISSVHIQPVIFTLFLCASAGCSSPDATSHIAASVAIPLCACSC
jgi:hypothetical protein